MRSTKIFTVRNVTMIVLLMRCFIVAALTALAVWYGYLFHANAVSARATGIVFSTNLSASPNSCSCSMQ
jgi:hypothetical protein